MVKSFTIYGERCSGTNYLEDIINKNFDISITWKYGWKHFFGFSDLENSDDTLFICIVRNPVDWMNSLYKVPYHLSYNNTCSLDNFLTIPIVSYTKNILPYISSKEFKINGINNGTIMKEDTNIFNVNKYYDNIFELRHCKNKYLIDILPKKVKNYILVRHEDLLSDFENTMHQIELAGNLKKKHINFINSVNYKNNPNFVFKKENKYHIISSIMIVNNTNYNHFYEQKLGYSSYNKINKSFGKQLRKIT